MSAAQINTMSDQIIKDKQKCSMSYMKRKVAVLTAHTKVNAGNLQAFWFSHLGVWGSATGTNVQRPRT